MAFPEVTLDRVKTWADQQELVSDIDDDGDLRVAFEEVIMFIHNQDNLLRVQGYWRGRFDAATEQARVVEVANHFNSHALMPKAIVIDGRGIVVFEHSTFTGAGLSDEQLGNVLSNTFASIFKAIEEFEQKLPDLVQGKDN